MSPTLFATPVRRVSQTSRSDRAGEVHTLPPSTSSSSSPSSSSFLRTLLSPLHPSSASRRKRERPKSTETETVVVPTSSPSPPPATEPERPRSWESEIEEWEGRRGSPAVGVAEDEEGRVGLDARLAVAGPKREGPVSPRSARVEREAEKEAGKRRKLVAVKVGKDGMTDQQLDMIHRAHSLRAEALFALSSFARAGLLEEAAEVLFEAYNPRPRKEGMMDLSEQHLADALGFVAREFERVGVQEGEGERALAVRGVEEDGWVEGLRRAGYAVEPIEEEVGVGLVRVRRSVDA